MRVRVAVACSALVLLSPGTALGATVAPSGNSSVSQYIETVPTAGGGRPSSVLPHHEGPSSISAATQAAMAALGASGEAAAALDVADAPSRGRPVSAVALGDATGGPTSSAIVRTLAGSGPAGLGIALPILLIAALAAAGGFAIRTYRRRP